MKSFFLTVILLFSFSTFASETFYSITPGEYPVKLTGEFNASDIQVHSSSQAIRIRYKIKKFIVKKTDQGWGVSFEPVCEENSTLAIDDLRNGGGIVVEKMIGRCTSTYKGEEVAVALSGMVYDNIMQDFQDESRIEFRNFFTHLQMVGTRTLFGVGDFNLGHTKALPFQSWVAELSTDQAGGGNPSLLNVKREGFVASVRFGH